MTYGDELRQKLGIKTKDAEIAKIAIEFTSCDHCRPKDFGLSCIDGGCWNAWNKWMKQEAKHGD